MHWLLTHRATVQGRPTIPSHSQPPVASRSRPCELQAGIDGVVSSYMLTVPEAARRASRDAETIRRWIRSGKLRAHKVGTQHIIEEDDLDGLLRVDAIPVPARWKTFESGRPQPDWVAAVERSRRGR